MLSVMRGMRGCKPADNGDEDTAGTGLLLARCRLREGRAVDPTSIVSVAVVGAAGADV